MLLLLLFWLLIRLLLCVLLLNEWGVVLYTGSGGRGLGLMRRVGIVRIGGIKMHIVDDDILCC